MKPGIYCLLLTGVYLTDDALDILYDVARDMLRDREDRVAFEAPSCEGVVTTAWDRASLGTLSGVRFTAEVALSRGTATVEYFLRENAPERDEDTAWYRPGPGITPAPPTLH